MTQILDTLPSEQPGQILCHYVNTTNQIQVVRIANAPNCYFERVIFPGQRVLFEALPDDQLEIHTSMMASAVLSDKIPCNQLGVN